MSTWILFVRIVHIASGVFWAGGAVVAAGFILPTVTAMGPDGGKFMQRFIGVSRFPAFMSLGAVLTSLSGLILYWRASEGLNPSWFATWEGAALSIGGAAGIATAVVGFFVNIPTAARLDALGQQIQASGGPPNDAQRAEMAGLQKRLRGAVRTAAFLLSVSVIAMAASRIA